MPSPGPNPSPHIDLLMEDYSEEMGVIDWLVIEMKLMIAVYQLQDQIFVIIWFTLIQIYSSWFTLFQENDVINRASKQEQINSNHDTVFCYTNYN